MSKLPLPILLFCLFLFPNCLPAQESAQKITLHFNPVFKAHSLLEGKTSFQLNGDSFSIHTLKFYLSNFAFFKNGREIWREQNSRHLLDPEDENTLSIALPTGAALDFDALKFDLGIDSLTNVSGALGGDLDPTKGMYWAWNSGYVNFKIEGFFEKCPARNHEFQFHLGGYLPPFQSLQSVVLPIAARGDIRVDMDLAVFFEQVDLVETHTVMSPSAEAVKLAKLVSTIFRIHEH